MGDTLNSTLLQIDRLQALDDDEWARISDDMTRDELNNEIGKWQKVLDDCKVAVGTEKSE